MAKASDGALFGRVGAAQLPQAERQRLESRHKHTSSISTGTRPTAPWITTAAACNPELWRDRGATAHVPCQALCVDANGKTCLASPMAGGDGDLIDADAVVVLLCSRLVVSLTSDYSLTGRLPCRRAASPQGPSTSKWTLISAHKPHGCPAAAEREGQTETRPSARHPIQGFRYPNVVCSGARYRCHRASAVMSTRLPVRAISLVTLSLRLTLPARLCSSQLVYTLCKIDSRPRRRSTWCHLRLAASRVDRCQAYFPIGFTNSTPAHAVPCCMRTVQTLLLLPSTASIGLVSANRRHALYAKASPGRHDL
jgi:hypothetical protein